MPNYTNLKDLSDEVFQALLKDLPGYDWDLAVEIEHLKSVKDVPDKYWDRFERYVLHKGQKNLETIETPIVLWPKWKKAGLIALTVFFGIIANYSRSWVLIFLFLIYAFLSSKLIIDTFKEKSMRRGLPQKLNNEEDTREYYEIGLEYMRNDDYQNAISNFTKAIEITPGVSGLYLAQGGCKMFLKDYQSAMDDFTKAIELSPKEANSYFQRALARQGLDGCIGDEAANDIWQAADLGDNTAIEWVSANLKVSIEDWTNSLLKDKEGFNMDESSEQYKYWAYQDSGDQNNEEWIYKFLDVAVECFISSRHETREELAKIQIAKVYADFGIYVLEFPFIKSRASLERLVPTLNLDIYDRLLFRLVNSELNDEWPKFYNTRLCDIHNKQGRGLEALEVGQ